MKLFNIKNKGLRFFVGFKLLLIGLSATGVALFFVSKWLGQLWSFLDREFLDWGVWTSRDTTGSDVALAYGGVCGAIALVLSAYAIIGIFYGAKKIGDKLFKPIELPQKLIVYCSTKKDLSTVIQLIKRYGFSSSDFFEEICWEKHGEESYIRIFSKKTTKILTYGSRSNFEEYYRDYPIMPAEDFLKKFEKK